MKFSFMKKFKEKEEVKLVPGDIVEFAKGPHLGTVCLVTYDRVVSLQHPKEVWYRNQDTEEEIRKVPPGSVVTLTQE